MSDPAVLRYAAFTLDGAGGNPAGVVLDAAGLTDAEMLAIAAELGYSESAFVGRPNDDGVRPLRYFSPRAEVPFCGHATIATAVAIAERAGSGLLRFATPVGEIPVETATDDQGDIVATLTSVPTSTRPATEAQVADTLAALHWAVGDLDPRFPPHVAFGGAHHLVLAAGTRERLAELDYDFAALDAVLAREGWITVALVFAESPTLFHARNPFPPGGIVEDPATGAAAAAFGGYLRELGLIAVGEPFTILQGEDLGRPSRLTVTALSTGQVSVAGSGAPIPA
jgi:PhzF family phenazine biosynthesis protein